MPFVGLPEETFPIFFNLLFMAFECGIEIIFLSSAAHTVCFVQCNNFLTILKIDSEMKIEHP